MPIYLPAVPPLSSRRLGIAPCYRVMLLEDERPGATPADGVCWSFSGGKRASEKPAGSRVTDDKCVSHKEPEAAPDWGALP
jgi:hypothetical protein